MKVMTMLLVLGIPLVAQSSEPVTPPSISAPQLTDMEKLWLELHRTQIALERALAEGASCRASLRAVQLSDDQGKLKQLIEQAHPGYLVDLNTGVLGKPKPVPIPPESNDKKP